MQQPDIDTNLVRLESGELFSDTEKYIIDLFLKTANAFEPNPPIVRIVGGYVRDALLGLPSNDLDISIQGVPCYIFAEKLTEFAGPNSYLKKINAHPDQAKRISVARVEVLPEHAIDICNLQVLPDSPETVATAVSDAQRRDLTINALAFNLTTWKVEDFVDGIVDLKSRFVRTPSDPYRPFSSDPLAILRAFRFALRFNFDIDPAIFPAAARVQNEFAHMTARSRIKVELCKIIGMPDALRALNWIIDAHLFLGLFDPKGEWKVDESIAIARARVALDRCRDPIANMIVLLTAVYFDVSTIRRVLKFQNFSSALGQTIAKLLHGVSTLPNLIGRLSRLSVGRWLKMVGPEWCNVRCLLFDEDLLIFWDEQMMPFITQEDLGRFSGMKHLLSGTDLADLHGIASGPRVVQLLADLFDWQILHPEEGLEDYKRHVKSS
jgi:tRNA nucleotidyltransferase (CCA-adding enzyme)